MERSGAADAAIPREEEPITVPLRADHRVQDFSTRDSSAVQDWLRSKAAGFHAAGLCSVFVLESLADPTEVWGYYSLSASCVSRQVMSNALRRNLGTEYCPIALLGYMGRDDRQRGADIGPTLLRDAALRAKRSRAYLGVWGLALEPEGGPENRKLWDWYIKHNLKPISPERSDAAQPNLMYAPLQAFKV